MREASFEAASYSVLMSVYAKESSENLRSCLDGIIGQTVPPEEICIVKDGLLTREIEKVLSEYDSANAGLFSFVSYPENRGLWHALRIGLPLCRNELVMRMDTDDLCVPDRAEKELAVLADHPEISCVGSLVTEFVGDMTHPVSIVELPEKQQEILRFGKWRCPFRHPTLVFRKSAVIAAGNYQKMPFFEDYDLFIRMAATGFEFYNIQESLVWIRASDDFFARRGSVAYLRKMLHFRRTCLKRGDLSAFGFVASTLPHAVVCLMPNTLRKWVYEKLLRAPAVRQDQD